jgi:hypothetical protein
VGINADRHAAAFLLLSEQNRADEFVACGVLSIAAPLPQKRLGVREK